MPIEANRPVRPFHRWRAIAAAAAALALVACEGAVGEPGRIVAHVNGYGITAGELVREISTMQAAGGASEQRALDYLIDRHLLAQEALEAGLDRDPQVREALERSRVQILGEAYLRRALAAPRPTAADIRRFYDEHPTLFRERRVYAFRVFVLERPDVPEELRASLDAAGNGAAVAAALKAVNLPFRETQSVRSAEQLPVDLLPRIAAMPKGGVVTLHEDGVATLMQLVDFVERPRSFEQARADIERYLANAAQEQLAREKLAVLRAAAHITYAEARDGRDNHREAIAIPDTIVRRP